MFFGTPCIFYIFLYVLLIVKDEEHSVRINSSSWEAVDLKRFMTSTTTTIQQQQQQQQVHQQQRSN